MSPTTACGVYCLLTDVGGITAVGVYRLLTDVGGMKDNSSPYTCISFHLSGALEAMFSCVEAWVCLAALL